MVVINTPTAPISTSMLAPSKLQHAVAEAFSITTVAEAEELVALAEAGLDLERLPESPGGGKSPDRQGEHGPGGWDPPIKIIMETP